MAGPDAPWAITGRHVAFVALLGALAFAAVPHAVGQGGDDGLAMSPERFNIAAAQPGESYVLDVLLQNRRGFDDTIDVTISGEAGAWASVAPASGFTLPNGSDTTIRVRLDVPDGAGPGERTGQVTFTGKPSTATSGSAVRPSLGLLLNVTVGGDPVEKLSWIAARGEDAEVGDPVHAYVMVRNDGNVRTRASASGEVIPFDSDDPVLSTGTGQRELVAGETAEVDVTFPSGLPIGQYRARLSSGGSFDQTVEFKVVPPGGQAASGRLRSVEHAPTVREGRPLRIDAWFENTDDIGIASAMYRGEVLDGDELGAVIESAALAVPAGTHANLTAYLTLDDAGDYTTRGFVVYDGYQTLPVETRLTVQDGLSFGTWWLWVLLVAVLAVALALVLYARRRRRKRRAAESRSQPRPPRS